LPSANQFRPTELRYRLADFINDRLKVVPGIHAAAKAAMATLLQGSAARRVDARAASVAQAAAPKPVSATEQPPAVAASPLNDSGVTAPGKVEIEHGAELAQAASAQISLDNLPIPPFEMRELVGPTDLVAFDNPTHALVYSYLEPKLYEKVFDFGCGCGRVARQLILQNPRPKLYVGVDLHAGMIRWCQRNLQPAAPSVSFLHHDVFFERFNPNPNSPSVAKFPVGDSQFTLVNALSVFTHLKEEQAVHYLRECARILTAEGVLHASWFFFDKREFPMLHPEDNALYVSYLHPGAAVIFDRNWVRATARQAGLKIGGIVPPQIRGHQWIVMMTKQQVDEPEFPPDTAPYGVAAAPAGARWDVSDMGLEPE